MRRKSLSPWRRFLKKFEVAGRDGLTKIVACLLGERRHYDTIPVAEIKTVLLFKIDERLGNMVILTPFVEMLHQALPMAEISYCAAKKIAPLVSKNPNISHVYGFKKWGFSTPECWPRLLWQLRHQHFDLAIDCSHPINKSVTHALLTRFVGARYTIGAHRSPLDRYYTTAVKIPVEIEAERLQYPHFLQPLGGKIERVPSLSYFPVKEVEQLSAAVTELLHNPPQVIVNMGAGTKDRFISSAFIRRILQLFEAAQKTTLITWGPAEEQLALEAIPTGSQFIKVAPPTKVDELYYLMKAARLVISGDTGPMHLAVASGTPTLALFIKGEPHRFGHNYPPHKVLLLQNEEQDLAVIKEYCESILGN